MEPRDRRDLSRSGGITGAGVVDFGFIQVRVGSRRRTYASFGFARFHSGTPKSRSVHSHSLGFTQARLGGLGISRVRLGSLRSA